ncbi:MAG: serine hydrolase [Planctomycetota bacterium]|nr:serine hydrolase [Planctomycetota bacterium]
MKIVAVCVLALLAACATSNRSANVNRDSELTSAIESLTAHFEGDVGIYVRRLTDGRTFAWRADEVFPTASMIKVPILIGVFGALERHEFEYRKPMKWDVSRKYDDHDVTARFEDGVDVEPAELVTFMCTFSDNTASLWLQELAGGGVKINVWLSSHGFEHTRVNSRTDGRETARKEFGWGQTTPREMAELLVAIRERRVVNPTASEEMERALSRSHWTEEALAPIPPQVHAMSKQGAVNRSRSEVLLVDAPHGAYVLCIITKNQKDESFEHENAGFQLLRDVSRAVYEQFERG